MISKLFRFQFKELSRLLFPVMGVSALIIALSSVVTVLNLQNEIIIGFATVISIIALSGGGMIFFLLSAITDYQNFYGKRAYLINSFPASVSQLFISRIMYYFFSYLLSSIFILIEMCYLLYMNIADEAMFELRYLWEMIKPFAIFIAVYFIIAIFVNLFVFMTANTIGSGSKLQRFGIGGPVLVYVILYIIIQVGSFISTIFVPIGIEFYGKMTATSSYRILFQSMASYYGKNLFNETAMESNLFIGIGVVAFLLILAIVLGITVYQQMNKKLCLK